MVAVNEQLRVGVIFRPRCKRWSCETCAKVNQFNWTRRAVIGTQYFMSEGYAVDLVTVTAHEKHDVQRAVEKLPDGWNKLRNRWQREVAKPQYMLTTEVGAEGHFHIHLITNKSPGERFWKDSGRASGFGYMAKESKRSVDPEKAGQYISKYLSKGLQNETWKKGFHRVRTSRGWPKIPPFSGDMEAGFYPFGDGDSIRKLSHGLSEQGYSVALADEKASWHVLKTGTLTEGASWLTMQTPIIE